MVSSGFLKICQVERELKIVYLVHGKEQKTLRATLGNQQKKRQEVLGNQ